MSNDIKRIKPSYAKVQTRVDEEVKQVNKQMHTDVLDLSILKGSNIEYSPYQKLVLKKVPISDQSEKFVMTLADKQMLSADAKVIYGLHWLCSKNMLSIYHDEFYRDIMISVRDDAKVKTDAEIEAHALIQTVEDFPPTSEETALNLKQAICIGLNEREYNKAFKEAKRRLEKDKNRSAPPDEDEIECFMRDKKIFVMQNTLLGNMDSNTFRKLLHAFAGMNKQNVLLHFWELCQAKFEGSEYANNPELLEQDFVTHCLNKPLECYGGSTEGEYDQTGFEMLADAIQRLFNTMVLRSTNSRSDGVKSEMVLVFRSDVEGLAKTEFCKALAPEPNMVYSESILNKSSREVAILTQGKILVVMEEAVGYRTADQEKMKSAISMTNYVWEPKFSNVSQTVLIRHTCVITTNDMAITTGNQNRRFVPVTIVDMIDRDWLAAHKFLLYGAAWKRVKALLNQQPAMNNECMLDPKFHEYAQRHQKTLGADNAAELKDLFEPLAAGDYEGLCSDLSAEETDLLQTLDNENKDYFPRGYRLLIKRRGGVAGHGGEEYRLFKSTDFEAYARTVLAREQKIDRSRVNVPKFAIDHAIRAHGWKKEKTDIPAAILERDGDQALKYHKKWVYRIPINNEISVRTMLSWAKVKEPDHFQNQPANQTVVNGGKRNNWDE